MKVILEEIDGTAFNLEFNSIDEVISFVKESMKGKGKKKVQGRYYIFHDEKLKKHRKRLIGGLIK